MRSNLSFTACFVAAVVCENCFGQYAYPATPLVVNNGGVEAKAATVFESQANGIAHGLKAVGDMTYELSLSNINNQTANHLWEMDRVARRAAGAVHQEAERAHQASLRQGELQHAQEIQQKRYEAAMVLLNALQQNGGCIEWPVTLTDSVSSDELMLVESTANRVAQGEAVSMVERARVRRAISHLKLVVYRSRSTFGVEKAEVMQELLRTVETLTTDAGSGNFLTASMK